MTFCLRRQSAETAELRKIIVAQRQEIADMQRRMVVIEEALRRRNFVPRGKACHSNLDNVQSWVRRRYGPDMSHPGRR